MLMQIFSLLFVLIAARYWWRRWKFDLHKVPSPPGLPLLGHTLEFFGQARHQFVLWSGNHMKQLGYPKLMRIDLMGRSWLWVTDMDFIRDVLMSKTAPFPKLNVMEQGIYPIIGNDVNAKSLFITNSPTPYAKAVRRVYTTAFQTSNLKTAMPEMDKVIQKAIDIIESNRKASAVDVQNLFVRMTLDIIGVIAFGSDMGGLDDSRATYSLIRQAVKEESMDPLRDIYLKLFPNCQAAQKKKRTIDNLTAEWDRLTKEVLERDPPSDGTTPIWSTLRNLIDPETEQEISYSSLRAELATVVITGMETTGHQLGWIFAFLASHPHVVEKVLQELEQHRLYGPDAREITFEDLGELTYLTSVIKEGMRVGYVGAVSFIREVPKDMTIRGYRIPKQTFIVCPSTRAATNEAEWDDPQAFRPERWLTDDDISHKYYLGFSYGPRDCVGQKLAMLEMRLTIINILVRYQISLQGTLNDLLGSSKDHGILTEAKDGIWLDMKPRSNMP